jgi:hypothetical protein
MANQTVTTAVNYDGATISGLLNGETITINGGSLTINADTRFNQQAAVFGNITVSSTLGGVVAIDGTQIWEVPFSMAVGLVPAQAALGSNTVTGGSSGATGELTRVWASGSFTSAVEGAAMPLSGFIKLRSRSGNFQAGEIITLPGGATIVATNAGQRSWIHVVGNSGSTMTTPRMANVTARGDWYQIGTTDGTDNQTIQMPVRDEFPAVQIETAAGSGVYEWWANAADSWNGLYPNTDLASGNTNTTFTRNAIAGPANYPAAERVRETAAAGVHSWNGQNLQATQMDGGSYTHRAIVKQETRQWCVVQLSTNGGADRYGALVDLVAGTIIANPTVGSPTGTASSITSLGGGWYQVVVTLDHVNNTNLTSFVALSNSATPTYVNGLPTYAGSTSEGVYVGFWAVVQNSHSFISTDEARGKFFYSDPFAGTIQFAKRGANDAGFKPASGLKIRIPNVILGTSTAADYTAQHLSFTSLRYAMNISGGVFNQDTVTFGWQVTNVTPITFTLKNSAFANSLGILNFYTEIRNSCIAPILYQNASTPSLSLQNSANSFLYDSRIVRAFGNAFFTIASANINVYRSRFEQIKQGGQGRSQRTSAIGQNPTLVSVVSSGGEFVDCTLIGGAANFNVQNYSILNPTHCDNMTGTTPAVASRAIGVQGTNILVEGMSTLAGIDNNHPFTDYISTTGFISNLTVRNIGSPAAPLNAGTINPTGYIVSATAPGTTSEVRRCYATNLRLGVIQQILSSPVFAIYDVWGDGTTPQTIATANAISRGGRWTNQRVGQAGNAGSHWDDAYNSTTTGRITISANEPTLASAAQCSATLGLGSGFNGSGSIVISRLDDAVNWTTPLKMYGHTAFAGGCAVTGTDCQNLIFEYKINTGSGYGASWEFLANTVRRSAGGASGTNTVTVNTADRTALTRQPQVGDFVQSSLFRLPADTTIANIAGDVITCSNNFTANLTATEFVTFSPVNVAVTAANGYLLQVRTYPIIAATTLLTALSMSIQTDATSQQIQHPLPGSLVNITNLIPQTRVKVTRADTGGLLQQASCGGGTTLNFDFQYTGSVKIEARNASSIPAYKPWITQVSISPTATTNVVALQESDQ